MATGHPHWLENIFESDKPGYIFGGDLFHPLSCTQVGIFGLVGEGWFVQVVFLLTVSVFHVFGICVRYKL